MTAATRSPAGRARAEKSTRMCSRKSAFRASKGDATQNLYIVRGAQQGIVSKGTNAARQHTKNTNADKRESLPSSETYDWSLPSAPKYLASPTRDMMMSFETAWDCFEVWKRWLRALIHFSALCRNRRKPTFRACVPEHLRRNRACTRPEALRTSSRSNRRTEEACGECLGKSRS